MLAREPLLAQSVQTHRQDYDRADDNFLGESRPIHQAGAIAQDLNGESAYDRSQNASAPATEAGPADHHGCDDVQLQPYRSGRITLG